MMSFRVDKSLKIITELTTFCYKQGFRTFENALEFKEKVTLIKIVSEGAYIKPEKLKLLKEILNVERQPELEQQYWELGGVSSVYEESELSLVGMMIDKTEISVEEDKMTMLITRKE